LSGKGKIVAFTVIGVGAIPMIKAGYTGIILTVSELFETEEGPGLTRRLWVLTLKNPENIKLGTELPRTLSSAAAGILLMKLPAYRRVIWSFGLNSGEPGTLILIFKDEGQSVPRSVCLFQPETGGNMNNVPPDVWMA
jgi:hypothetical protein